eukprot:TRINITY_DN112_c1_g2_i1.p1 TRINITY_DN112_c1_g2~~TRINITY_DN112_c1_g2_i1.p1  ORF type:complete len:463 (-),score=234.70 TRINITY_DN112_c1_g2_i1:10-1398(-)
MSKRPISQSVNDEQTIQIEKAVKLLTSTNNEEVYQNLQYLRKLLSLENNPPISQIVAAGAIRPMKMILKKDDEPKLQYESCWALTNIASGSSLETEAVVNEGVVDEFIRFLCFKDDQLCEQAIWAIGNIAGDCARFRDMLLNLDALEKISKVVLQERQITLLRNATWAMANLCRGKPQPALCKIQPALPTIAKLIHHSDSSIVADALWALSWLSDGENRRIQALLDCNILPDIVTKLDADKPDLIVPALRCVGNIASGDEMQTEMLVSTNVLEILRKLLNNVKKSIRKETCWTLSNILAGSISQIQAVIDADLIPILINIIDEEDISIRKEALFAIANGLTTGNSNQIQTIINYNCITPLCKQLQSNLSTNTQITTIIIEAIQAILIHAEKTANTFNSNQFKTEIKNYSYEQLYSLVDKAGLPRPRILQILDILEKDDIDYSLKFYNSIEINQQNDIIDMFD